MNSLKSLYVFSFPISVLIGLLPLVAIASNSTLEEEMFGGATQLGPASAAPTEQLKAARSDASAPQQSEDKNAETLTLGGRLELQATLLKSSSNSFGDSPVNQSTGAELYLDSRPTDDLRGFVKGALTQRKAPGTAGSQSVSNDISLYEMWIKWGGKSAIYTTVGKQKLKWGAASFWNPTDFLAVQNKDPLATYDIRPGANLVKLHMPFEKSGHNLYAIVDLENTTSAHSPRLATRAEFNYGFGDFTGELTTTLAGGKDQPLRFGLDLSTGLGPVDLILESAWTRRSNQKFYEKITTENGNIEFKNRDRAKSAIPQVVAGLRYDIKYSDSDSANVSVEYFWNDAGYSDVALEAYSFIQGQTQRLYLANRYAAASLVLAQPGSFNDSTLIFSALANLADKSWLARTSLSHKISTRSRIEFAIAKTGGAGEFSGGIPRSVVDKVKSSANLPTAARDALDRVSGVQQDFTLSLTAGIDL